MFTRYKRAGGEIVAEAVDDASIFDAIQKEGGYPFRPFHAYSIEGGALPDEARFVRFIGCPDTRQVAVYELGFNLFVKEVATRLNPEPGDAVFCIAMAQTLKSAAASLFNVNDGKPVLMAEQPEA